MNRMFIIFFSTLFLLSIASGIRAAETTDKFGHFGKIYLYRLAEHPAHVVLFISGDALRLPGCTLIFTVSQRQFMNYPA